MANSNPLMLIDVKYYLGQTVYLKTDTEQLPRIVTMWKISQGNQVLYQVSNTDKFSEHYDFELREDVDVVLKTNS